MCIKGTARRHVSYLMYFPSLHMM